MFAWEDEIYVAASYHLHGESLTQGRLQQQMQAHDASHGANEHPLAHEVASLVHAISCDVAVKATMAVGRTPGVTLCNREDDSGANNRWID